MAEQNPLDISTTLQPMVAKEVAKQSKALKALQYTPTPVPIHTHNGTDSNRVAFASLQSASQYAVISRLTLTSAQILALETTRVQLLPQPGINTSIIVESITAYLNFNSIAYTGANPIQIFYGGQIMLVAVVPVTVNIPSSFINSAANAIYHAPAVTAGFIPETGGVNALKGSIALGMGTANPGAGNSTITLVTKYHIVPFN